MAVRSQQHRGHVQLLAGGGLVLTPSLTAGTLTELSDGGRRLASTRVAPAARGAALVVLP